MTALLFPEVSTSQTVQKTIYHDSMSGFLVDQRTSEPSFTAISVILARLAVFHTVTSRGRCYIYSAHTSGSYLYKVELL